DAARDLVSRDARQLQPGELPRLHEHVAVAHATGLDLDPHLARTRLRHLALDLLERAAGLAHLHRSHLRHEILAARARAKQRTCASGHARATGRRPDAEAVDQRPKISSTVAAAARPSRTRATIAGQRAWRWTSTSNASRRRASSRGRRWTASRYA